jgi:ABC-type polysaccharide/polyol phosphate export permease
MFEIRRRQTRPQAALRILALIYHGIVRNVRKTHGNALVGLIMNMVQAMVLVATFYIMFTVLGLRKNAIRGDFIIYLLSGIFLYLTHSKALGAVLGSDGPTSPLMKHAPMNTVISITSAALSALYLQVLAMALILFGVHVVWHPLEIYDPVGLIAPFLLAWFSGVAIGMVFLAIKPWFPEFVSIASTIYNRANMIASGKMFVANTLTAKLLGYFSWNPLFHTIDQARGAAFINYNPRYTNLEYPLILSIVFVTIGLMGEFYTRRRASLSWSAAR